MLRPQKLLSGSGPLTPSGPPVGAPVEAFSRAPARSGTAHTTTRAADPRSGASRSPVAKVAC
jgi:hypothetical protein